MTGRLPDYWCHVALNYVGNCAYIVAESIDCLDDCLLDDPDLCDIVGDEWAKGLPPGLYRLTLRFDIDSGDMSIITTEPLVAFPPLPSSGPDYLKITQDVLLGSGD